MVEARASVEGTSTGVGKIHPWSEAPAGDDPARSAVMDEIEGIATLLGTVASWTVWVVGLAVLALMAALPLLEYVGSER